MTKSKPDLSIVKKNLNNLVYVSKLTELSKQERVFLGNKFNDKIYKNFFIKGKVSSLEDISKNITILNQSIKEWLSKTNLTNVSYRKTPYYYDTIEVSGWKQETDAKLISLQIKDLQWKVKQKIQFAQAKKIKTSVAISKAVTIVSSKSEAQALIRKLNSQFNLSAKKPC